LIIFSIKILSKTFPYDELCRTDIHNKRTLSTYNDEFKKFLCENKEWERTIDYFESNL